MLFLPAERIEAFAITTAPATAVSAPAATALTFPTGELVGVELSFAPGPGGLSGIRLRQANQPVIPRTAGGFIVGENETVTWPLEGFHETGQWSAQTYNTDGVAHTIYVRFLLREIVRRPDRSAALLEPLRL